MNDQTESLNSGELSVELPPNARLDAIEFHDDAREVRVSFLDGGDRTVSADRVASLHGGRVPSERIPLTGQTSIVGPLGWPGFLRRTTVPRPVDPIEELHFALALRATGVGELWYLLADSFNFRKALGPDAGYSTEINLRTLMRKLAAFAPRATQDGFFTAVLGGMPLPPPVGSLIEFFRTVGKDLT